MSELETLRQQLIEAEARLASHGEQIAQLTKAIKQWEERDEILRQKVDDYQWDIGQLERQSTVLRQRTAELEADLTAALTARDEAERRNQWQEIETAPKDGREVLVVTETTRRAIAFWRADKGRWHEQAIGHCAPTHWMPLPSPPSDPSADPPKGAQE